MADVEKYPFAPRKLPKAGVLAIHTGFRNVRYHYQVGSHFAGSQQLIYGILLFHFSERQNKLWCTESPVIVAHMALYIFSLCKRVSLRGNAKT